MATVESAWDRYPDYRIDLVAVRGTARVWHGDLLLAESPTGGASHRDRPRRAALPSRDRCPVGGPGGQRPSHRLPVQGRSRLLVAGRSRATRWRTCSGPTAPPSPQVAGIQGYLGVYHEKVRVEIETRWDGDPTLSTVAFPAWGDEDDLLQLIDACTERARPVCAPRATTTPPATSWREASCWPRPWWRRPRPSPAAAHRPPTSPFPRRPPSTSRSSSRWSRSGWVGPSPPFRCGGSRTARWSARCWCSWGPTSRGRHAGHGGHARGRRSRGVRAL